MNDFTVCNEANCKLKQERDELAAQVEVMRGEFKDFADNYDCDADAHKYGTRCRVCVSQKILSITTSDALREVKARTLEDAANELKRRAKIVQSSGIVFVAFAEELLLMAAAIRKGE